MCDVITHLYGPISHRPTVTPERVTVWSGCDPIAVPLPQFRFNTTAGGCWDYKFTRSAKMFAGCMAFWGGGILG